MALDTVTFLAQVPIFSGMKSEDLRRIARTAEYRSFKPGEVIIREGDFDGTLFVVTRGRVDVTKGAGEACQRCLATLGPPCYFGEMALIDDTHRSATVVAKDETEVISLDRLNLLEEIEHSPTMALEMLRELSRRLRALEKSVIKTLGGLLPICARCKKIREDGDSWVSVEKYISDHSEADFTHGVCPECAKILFPRVFQKEMNPPQNS